MQSLIIALILLGTFAPKDSILQESVDSRGLHSVVFTQEQDTFALDYLNEIEYQHIIFVTQAPVKELIADETYYSLSGEKQFKIITYNVSIFSELFKLKGDKINKISMLPKTDRQGNYWEYTLYFDKEYMSEVLSLPIFTL